MNWPWLSFPRSIHCLNIAQFLGAVNDNLFKLLLIYFFLRIEGLENASLILSTVGAIYVIPFLLFSPLGGGLADRFSKSQVIFVLKTVEILITIAAVWAFAQKSIWGLYGLFFLLSTHSALFSPSKYGIIAELADDFQVPRVNGLITGFTYLAVIIGTFLASFLTQLFPQAFVWSSLVCFLFSVIGWIASWGIPSTPHQGRWEGYRPFLLRELTSAFAFTKEIPHLRLAILGSSLFLFMGSFTQLNIIPYAVEALQLSDVGGGYLFLVCAIGIAGGAYFTGKRNKKPLRLHWTMGAGALLTLDLLGLYLLKNSLWGALGLLLLLGFSGGVFIVTCDSFIQLHTPAARRGQVIALSNFASFLGVMLAAFLIFVTGEVFKRPAKEGFLLMGIIGALVTIYYYRKLRVSPS